MKSVLMVVYSLSAGKFPKADNVMSFISQLRNYGWEPVVLTSGAVVYTQDEPALQIPENIDIVRTGLFTDRLDRVSSLPKFLSSLLESDGQKLWEFLSRRKAARIIKNGGADLLYTVSSPHSSHLIGLRLKKKHPNLPWVADLSSMNIPGKNVEKNLLARLTDSADIIVRGESNVHTQELSELFEKACRAIAAKKMENP